MLKLKTVYPYGLNNHLGVEYKKEVTHVLIGNKLSPLYRKHDRVSRGTVQKNNISFSPDEFLMKLKHHISHNS